MTGKESESNSEYSEYLDFIRDLRELIELPSKERQKLKVQQKISSALNGEATEALHRLIDRATLKKDGVFFTPKMLAAKLIQMLPLGNIGREIFYDPACGTGNLLLECANLLPVFGSFDETVRHWGHQLRGHDLHSQFIETTKLRLVLLAIKRGRFNKISFSTDSIFPHICVGDSLADSSGYESATCTVMNPPFTHCTNKSLTWSSGRVSSAAVHYDRALEKTSNCSVIAAILPDVLRSGSRYEKWRQRIADRGSIDVKIESEQFTKHADVNTFYLVLNRSNSPNSFKWHDICLGKKIEQNFQVNIGSVVPHRHPDAGNKVPFLHAKRLEPWATINEVTAYRGFNGTCRKGPFVVIRRTSRPDDKYRAVGTVVADDRKIAIENHLIVCTPMDGSLATCHKLLKLLKDQRLTEWLNKKIRCRHLTVESILSAPSFEYF